MLVSGSVQCWLPGLGVKVDGFRFGGSGNDRLRFGGIKSLTGCAQQGQTV